MAVIVWVTFDNKPKKNTKPCLSIKYHQDFCLFSTNSTVSFVGASFRPNIVSSCLVVHREGSGMYFFLHTLLGGLEIPLIYTPRKTNCHPTCIASMPILVSFVGHYALGIALLLVLCSTRLHEQIAKYPWLILHGEMPSLGEVLRTQFNTFKSFKTMIG